MSIIEELGAVGSLINGLAMVGSVVYLAVQVRQANRLARLTAIDALRDATNQFREILLAGNNTEVWLKGIQRNDELSDLERYKWDELALYLWDSTQATYLSARHLGERFAVKRVAYTVRFASAGKSRFQTWWDARRERFHPDFAAFVDANIGQPVEALATRAGAAPAGASSAPPAAQSSTVEISGKAGAPAAP